MSEHLISWMILLPFLGAIVQAFMFSTSKDGFQKDARKWISVMLSLSSSLIGFILIFLQDPASSAPQKTELFNWFGAFSITYHVGLDGLNILLVFLIAIIFPILIAYEWYRKEGVEGIQSLLLLLQGAFLGTVCSRDIFLLFFFWAFSVQPFYFLISIWGEKEKEKAAFRQVVAGNMGNAFMLMALFLIFFSNSTNTFSFDDLAKLNLEGSSLNLFGQSFSVATLAFLCIGIGLIFRVPLWPFNGWFGASIQGAPPSVLVVLGAINLPVASYIFIRLGFTLFPKTLSGMAETIALIGTINILIASISAILQRNLRNLFALICLGEVGILLLGIGSMNLSSLVGAVFHQLAFGLALSGFGLFIGLLQDRLHKTEFLTDEGESAIGGLVKSAPFFAVVVGLLLASMLAIPGFVGFVGHALLLIGAYGQYPANATVSVFSMLFFIYTLFKMYQHVFLGTPSEQSKGVSDLTWRERMYFFPMMAALIMFGLYPKPLLDLVRPTVSGLVEGFKGGQ